MRGKLRHVRFLPLLVCVAVLVGRASSAQYTAEPELAPGAILLANAKLADPNFAQTVILIVQFEPENGAEGLILNRQSELSLAGIFADSKRATKDPVYMGGPVQIRIAQALLRLPDKTGQAIHVVSDIYVSGAKELIDKSIDAQTEPSKFRLYLGYAGWASGQLQAELRLGAWSLLSGSSKLIFDAHPETLWARLTHNTQTRLADAAPFSAPGWFLKFPGS
ncbi:MAG: YqgE/AlgH family protein [Acidobacteriaceae bacterium]|nr:YqgE/AlgH family protein [Acidobacteriaceae bacterium]